MARWHRLEKFSGTETRAVKLPADDGKFGRLAVHVRETAGSGSATLAVRGAFTAVTGDLTQSIQVTAPTGTGSGALVQVTALTDFPYPYVHLVVTNSGASENDVLLTFL